MGLGEYILYYDIIPDEFTIHKDIKKIYVWTISTMVL